MSTAEPGTQPVTFRAAFAEEQRARREHADLLHLLADETPRIFLDLGVSASWSRC